MKKEQEFQQMVQKLMKKVLPNGKKKEMNLGKLKKQKKLNKKKNYIKKAN